MGITLLESSARAQDAAWEGLINAGRAALQQQNFAEAERHFESALEAAERFPSNDPRLGKSFNNLAAVYYAQEDYARAEPLMRRALAQLRQSLGPENTEVAQTMKNLAALYFLQGNRSEAEALLKQALEVLESVHGPNHAFVATVLSNLAGLYQAENRYRDAEPLLTRSLAIWEGLLGSDHPDVVKSRELLAQVREAQGGGRVGQGEATAAESPRALTPAIVDATEDEADRSDAAAAEVERATVALEELTKASRAEAEDRTQAESFPAPALSPIGDAVNAITPNAITPNTDDATAAIDAATSPATESGQEVPVAGVALEQEAEGDEPGIATSSPALAPTASNETATAAAEILNADDVSYAVYLSTLWSIDEARRYWQAMQDAMPEVLRGKQMEIEAVAAGDGADPFYRVLTAPYTSDPEAQAACERIKSKLRTHDCNVVVRGATAGG